ncbi:MAG TPA: serine/threonine-protein kinase [Streptosporangiaceae bacterium]
MGTDADATAHAPSETPEPLPGAPAAIGDVLLGRWSVAAIHRGGQAWVLVVDDAEFGDRRAIKIPISSGTLTGDAELVTLLGLDRHPHVVTALDVTELDGRRGLVLEYAPQTLAGVLGQRRGTTLSAETPWLIPRAEVLQEICAGMAYLSEHGEFAHLDLKPSNVLIDAAGHAKVADFGLARQVRTRDGRVPAAAGGTWAYAAPEVIRQEPCDSRADIFSFGVLLYEVCTGRLPYPFPLASTPAAQREQLLDYYASKGPEDRTKELYYWDQSVPAQVPIHPRREEISITISSCLQVHMGKRPHSFPVLARMIAADLRIPEVGGDPAPLAEPDRQHRELALAQAMIRLGRFEEAVRRLNRLLAAPPLPALSGRVLQAAQQALSRAGRPDEAAALEEWR